MPNNQKQTLTYLHMSCAAVKVHYGVVNMPLIYTYFSCLNHSFVFVTLLLTAVRLFDRQTEECLCFYLY